MYEFVSTIKALADEGRLRVLMALREGELCVCQITELLGLAPSTVSKHLSILRRAGLVCGRKEGRWMYFRLPSEGGSECLLDGLKWIESSLENFPEIVADSDVVKRMKCDGMKNKC